MTADENFTSTRPHGLNVNINKDLYNLNQTLYEISHRLNRI